MQIDKIMSIIIQKCGDKLNEKQTIDHLNENIFHPIINHIFLQLYPYIILFSVIILTLFVLLISILFLNIRSMHR